MRASSLVRASHDAAQGCNERREGCCRMLPAGRSRECSRADDLFESKLSR